MADIKNFCHTKFCATTAVEADGFNMYENKEMYL